MRVAPLLIGTEAFVLAIRHRQADDRPFNRRDRGRAGGWRLVGSGRYRLSRSRTLRVTRATVGSPLSPCDQSVVPAVNTVPPRA